ncbi:hypothetical protein B0H16DRAFT_1731606 [Mycena metata]|uniref:NB-ARC domain-containing protein n=1 Tax=Mycena metata TaxID=1033252 RepID=A0AAD7MW94_9AGAR|nr:hypothetical protein B0H16DRAFT_1731606 [Mycena metata]
MLKELCEEFLKHLQGVLPVLEKLQKESQGFRGRVKEVLKAGSTASKIMAYQKSIQQLQSDFKFMTLVDIGFKVNEIQVSLTSVDHITIPVDQSVHDCPPPSRIFQGRQTILAKMHKFFTPDSGKQLIYVLHGLGGAGKTHIALKFIQESPANFSDTFFVDASTLDTINTSLKNIAKCKSAGDLA